MSRIFGTALTNVEQLVEHRFVIPTYQRPYVWGYDQIVTLLRDIKTSYDYDPSSKYYIGTILTKSDKNDVEHPPVSELIDGQQRFTTIWLIAYCFKKLDIKTSLSNFLQIENRLRLGFEIRTEVEQYLTTLLELGEEKTNAVLSKVQHLPFVRHIAKAIATIENFLQSNGVGSVLGDYIYTNVYFVNNQTPTNIDLNKLFTTINSSGLQLEQTDIVKSQLLKKLGSDKIIYSKLWEVCEQLNFLFERNVRESFGTEVFKGYYLDQWIPFQKFKKCDSGEDIKVKGRLLSDIIKDSTIVVTEKTKEIDEENRKSEEVYCRSIINFPQLLIHTYRIHLAEEGKADINGTFHANRVIEIFQPLIVSDDLEIKRFLERLWDVRQMFDLDVIKWVTDTTTKVESLEIINLNRNSEGYYSKTNYAIDELHQLQSMLYFTGDYLRQYWLSPYLNNLYQNKERYARDEQLSFLEKIDNEMSISNLTDKEASWELLISDSLTRDFDFSSYMNQPNGVRFKHYWFQKLEYILYKNWKDKSNPKYKKYRITSKNSVEHLNPQTPKTGGIILEENVLNSFGNLVLLSVSQNSEYSNKFLDVKRSEFNNKPDFDTLKSALAFETDSFETEEGILNHQNEMIDFIQQHYNLVNP